MRTIFGVSIGIQILVWTSTVGLDIGSGDYDEMPQTHVRRTSRKHEDPNGFTAPNQNRPIVDLLQAKVQRWEKFKEGVHNLKEGIHNILHHKNTYSYEEPEQQARPAQPTQLTQLAWSVQSSKPERLVQPEKSELPEDDFKCTLPPHTLDKNYVTKCRDEAKCGKNPGDTVPELTTLLLHCNQGYRYDQMPLESHCVKGNWVPFIGKCKRICKALEPENVELSCYRTEDNVRIPCNGSLVQGIKVSIECLPYHHVEVPVYYNEITCKSNGEWNKPLFKCIPDHFGDSPWNVAIYDYDVSDQKTPTQICGGTIISPHLIVSAAHCFFDDNNKKLFSAEKYEIAVGKMRRDYTVKDHSETAFYKVHKIMLPDTGYNGPSTNYAGDIAILQTEKKINISAVVLPACLQLDSCHKFDLASGKALGKVVGWGHDSKENPSEILLTANLPYFSRNHCLRKVVEDFQSSISLDKFCAGSVNFSGPGAKQGDSGGGFMYFDPQSQLYFLHGVVSIKDPSTSTSLAAFTDISFYAGWIGKIMNKVEKSVSGSQL